MNATTLNRPNLKSLTGCLIIGLVIKIALSTPCPGSWL